MRHSLPNLNFLVTFEIAGQLLSFKQAAEVLHVTPSAVSQQIHALEEALGTPLFVRHNRQLSLTEAGRGYLTQVRQHLNGLRKATDALQAVRGSRLRVSVMPPVAGRVVLPGMERFRQLRPNLELELETTLANADVSGGEVDLAIRFGRPPWPGLIHEKLSDVWVQVVMPKGFTRRYGLDRGVEGMTRVPLVHMTGRPDSWPHWFHQAGLSAPEGQHYRVDDYPAAIQAAESLGAALALYPVEKSLTETGRVEAPFPPVGPLDEAIYAVYSEQRMLPEGGRAFIDWVQSELSELSAL
ncbi:MAG: LysR substrate-binding domain-containing protein [Pseudomonadota bacterium]